MLVVELCWWKELCQRYARKRAVLEEGAVLVEEQERISDLIILCYMLSYVINVPARGICIRRGTLLLVGQFALPVMIVTKGGLYNVSMVLDSIPLPPQSPLVFFVFYDVVFVVKPHKKSLAEHFISQ